MEEITTEFHVKGWRVKKGTSHAAYIGGAVFPLKLLKVKSSFPSKIISSKNDMVFPVLIIDYYLEDYLPNSDELRVFDKIVSTFRFIEK